MDTVTEQILFFLSCKNQDKIPYIYKGNKVFIHIECQIKTISSMVTKKT